VGDFSGSDEGGSMLDWGKRINKNDNLVVRE
jgi:hypothetical protein